MKEERNNSKKSEKEKGRIYYELQDNIEMKTAHIRTKNNTGGTFIRL